MLTLVCSESICRRRPALWSPVMRSESGRVRLELGRSGVARCASELGILPVFGSYSRYLRCEARTEGGEREPLCILARLGWIEVEVIKSAYRFGQRVDVVGRDQTSCSPVEHRFERPAGRSGEHRSAGRLRLDGGDAELLGGGE